MPHKLGLKYNTTGSNKIKCGVFISQVSIEDHVFSTEWGRNIYPEKKEGVKTRL